MTPSSVCFTVKQGIRKAVSNMSRMNALSVKQLRLVALLGDVQSIQIAASLLGMTQSTATKSLQKIESLLEIQLFHRTNKGILPTRAGLTFLGHAKTILQSVDRADKDIQNIRHGRKGELALGAPIGASRAALQKAIVLHAKKYQDIVVNVKEAPSLVLHAMLIARELDCVIGRRAQPSDVPGVSFDVLYSEVFCLCVRAGHPLSASIKMKLSELDGYSWILPPTEMRARQAIDASFHDAGLAAPARFIETVGLQGKELLLDTDMIGIWPYQAIRTDYLRQKLVVLDIALPRTMTQIGLSTVSHAVMPPYFEDFCNAVRSAGQEIEQNQCEWKALFSL